MEWHPVGGRRWWQSDVDVRLGVSCWKLIWGCRWLHFSSLPGRRLLPQLKTEPSSRSFWPPQDSEITHSSTPSLVKFNKGDTKWKEGLIPLYSPARIWSWWWVSVLCKLPWQVNLTSTFTAILTSCRPVQQVTAAWFSVPTAVIKTTLDNYRSGCGVEIRVPLRTNLSCLN